IIKTRFAAETGHAAAKKLSRGPARFFTKCRRMVPTQTASLQWLGGPTKVAGKMPFARGARCCGRWFRRLKIRPLSIPVGFGAVRCLACRPIPGLPNPRCPIPP
ncbi:MAG: hypothetical protein QE272_10420, partial [Nevskia sp.]|nr:hypothetical protein [Nevskia sp.]